MKLGVLSDTHDNLGTLCAALDTLRQEGVRVVIHCGDLIHAQLVPLFRDFETHIVQGNTDAMPGAIVQAVLKLGNGSTYGATYDGQFEGVRVAAIHGDSKAARKALQHSGLYDYVFYGHTHERKDKMSGSTRVINPGALGGRRHESRSFCIVDLKTGHVQFIELD